MKIVKSYFCGFCLKNIPSNEEKAIGVHGVDGFICIDCIKLAKAKIDKIRKREEEETNKGA